MSYTKNYHIKCDGCGKFCIPFDDETPFGCNNQESPEPLDPYHYCKECSKDLEKNWLEKFKNGSKDGYWQKSKAEIKAAQKIGLIWIGSNGIGDYKNGTHINYRYVTKEEYNLLTT